MLMVLFYHMMTFSSFNISLDTKFVMGYSHVTAMGIMIIINIGNLLINVQYSLFRRRRLNAVLKRKTINHKLDEAIIKEL